jgi:hypothetical protein
VVSGFSKKLVFFCPVYVGLLRRSADRALRFAAESAAAFGKFMSILPTFCLWHHCGCSIVFFFDDAASDLVSRISHRTSDHSAMRCNVRAPFANPSLEMILRWTFVLIAPFLQLPAPSYHPSRRGHEARTRTCLPGRGPVAVHLINS